MTKKLGFLLVVLLSVSLYGQNQGQQPQQQAYHPLFADVSNSAAAQNDMLSNTYRVEDTGGGYLTAFRLHKNWFLSCGHGLFQMMNKNLKKPVLRVKISVKKRPDAPGSSAPFALVVDRDHPDAADANGKVFFLNPTLQLDGTNNGRGEDLVLIYISDTDPSQPALGQTKQKIQQMEEQLGPMKDMLPKEMLAGFKNDLSAVEKEASSTWEKFLNHPIKPFHLFILSEQTVIDELGYPGITPYYFPLTAYYIHKPKMGVVKFTFNPLGTHRGTNAIFYKRVTNLISGTSGSPMTYGNYVVSVDSAVNCSPMLTDKFYNWLRKTMGKDYVKGMCVTPNPPTSPGTAAHGPTDPDWNDAHAHPHT